FDPLGVRTAFFTLQYPRFCQNIYQQPYLVGQFLQAHYRGASVAMNDIGTGSYFAEIALTDMVGIGDQAVHDIRVADRYTPSTIDSLTRSRAVRIAIVHDIWVSPVIPPSWIKVATWTIPENLICADATLSFYAVDEVEALKLRTHLHAFHSQIPSEVDIQFIP
ncbi:MAG: hypothetical protein AAFR59_19975, partial [Bacteroidota bacterium]